MHAHITLRRSRRAPQCAILSLLALFGAHAAQAGPAIFEQLPDPRTVGSLPPKAAASTAEPLRPSYELPDGALWLHGEIPSGTATPEEALRGTNASVGARLPLTLGGIELETAPTLTGAVARPGTAAGSPALGFAVAQTVSVTLPKGVRLSAEGTVGDRMGVFGPEAAAPVGASPLAMRVGATLSAELGRGPEGRKLRIGLGISTSGGFAHGGPNFQPADCKLSLDIGRVGGTPVRVSAPCPQHGATAPITIGFKQEF